MSFTAPENYKEFYNSIYQKSLIYIQLGYWDKITKVQLDTWLNNFKNDAEKYLASLILNNLTYRNEASILSSLNNVFFIDLPKYLKDKKVFTVTDLDQFRLKLYSPQLNFSQVANFRFTTIATGDLGESGHLYIKYLRDHFVSSDLIVDISSEKDPQEDEQYYQFVNIPSRIKTIIFIDDFIGSGVQINTFIADNNKKLKQFDNIIFMPLIAHQQGIDTILEDARKERLNISIIPVELITYENSYFYFNSDQNTLFDGENTIRELHKFYQELIDEKDINDINNYGYGSLGLTHIFSTGVPDNNLPIIYKTNENWQALKEKR